MKKQLLLPRKCKTIGALLFPFGTAWMVIFYFFNRPLFPFLEFRKGGDLFNNGFIFSRNFGADFNGELSLLTVLASLLMMAFSREATEDEYIMSLRLRSLQQSIYINYLLLALGSMLFYSVSYVFVLQANLFSMLLIFICIFNYHLHLKPRFSKTPMA